MSGLNSKYFSGLSGGGYTPNTVLVTNSEGNLESSSITTTELEYIGTLSETVTNRLDELDGYYAVETIYIGLTSSGTLTAATIPFNTTLYQYTCGNSTLMSLSSNGIYVPAGYMVDLEGLIIGIQTSSYDAWYGTKIQRSGTDISSVYGGVEVFAGDDNNTGPGCAVSAAYFEEEGAVFTVYKESSNTRWYRGGSTYGQSYLRATLYKPRG